MKRTSLFLIICVVGLCACSKKSQDAKVQEPVYAGTPFEDIQYKGGAQAIPGKVYCPYYDFGGEGIAYHDTNLRFFIQKTIFLRFFC